MKIAVLFPGIGYHCDKPLLYYSGKLAANYQYKIIRVSYTNLDKSIPKAFADACAQTEEQLENIDWHQYEEILFISKSIGTSVAAAYAQKHDISCRNVYYTPLPQTFDFAPQSGIVFHGTSDPWAETAVIRQKCLEHGLPLYTFEHANHSLEIPAEDVSSPAPAKSRTRHNLHVLENSMELTEQYIAYGIHYRTLCENEICPELFGNFVRRQEVVKCWRKEKENGNEKWVIRDDPFIDDWAVEDASYLKLSNVTLGYTFPKHLIARVGLKNLRLYATGNNLLTWTKYTGFDPEVSTMKSGLTPGVDFGAYPLSRSFIFGLNVAF